MRVNQLANSGCKLIQFSTASKETDGHETKGIDRFLMAETVQTANMVPLAVTVEDEAEYGGHQDHAGSYEVYENPALHPRLVYVQQVSGSYRCRDPLFLYQSSASGHSQWWVSNEQSMKAQKAEGYAYVNSTATSPDTITEEWQRSCCGPDSFNYGQFVRAPHLKLRAT